MAIERKMTAMGHERSTMDRGGAYCRVGVSIDPAVKETLVEMKRAKRKSMNYLACLAVDDCETMPSLHETPPKGRPSCGELKTNTVVSLTPELYEKIANWWLTDENGFRSRGAIVSTILTNYANNWKENEEEETSYSKEDQ